MIRAAAAAKLNLSLVVGPARADGLHELTSVFQRIDIVDRIAIEEARGLLVEGFADDTLARAALSAIIDETGCDTGFRVNIEKSIPVAAGLGGGSADAGTVLSLANDLLGKPLDDDALARIGFGLGADVPFFLRTGPQLVEGAGERCSPVELPQDYWVLLALPDDIEKSSTAEIYGRFDRAKGERGYAERRADLLAVLAGSGRASDLGLLPANDLGPHTGGLPLVQELADLGAFRADVSGAGPAAYGLFSHQRQALAARERLRGAKQAWVTVPVW